MIFKLKRKVEKGERNDEMTRQSKSKAYFGINLNSKISKFSLKLNIWPKWGLWNSVHRKRAEAELKSVGEKNM